MTLPAGRTPPSAPGNLPARTPGAQASPGATRLPATARFRCACLIGFCERAGYYTFLGFAVVYLGELGFGPFWPGLLIGSGLGVLVYALQLCSGALADRVGFRKALVFGSALMGVGYGALAWPVCLGASTLVPIIRPGVTVGPAQVLPILAGLVLLACGRSLLSPTCAALVHGEAAGSEVVAFGAYFTLGHAGNLAGLALCWLLRPASGLRAVFTVAGASAGIALACALCLPPGRGSAPATGPPFQAVVKLLREPRFCRFTLITAGFFALYSQVFILLPLYLKTMVEPDPALELYGAIIPLAAVTCQLSISRASRGLTPAASIALGTALLGLGALLNLLPLALEGGARHSWGGLRAGTLAALGAMASGSLGSQWVLPRLYEHLGSLAPPGRAGTFLALPSLIMALGHLAGGALGPVLLNQVMARGALPGPDGLVVPAPGAVALGWGVFAALGLGVAGASLLAPDPARSP